MFISNILLFGSDLENGIKSYIKGDYKEAVKYYTLAANQGDDEAQYTLGAMYYNSLGVRQDFKEAKDFFGKSCDNGFQAGCDSYRNLNEKGY